MSHYTDDISTVDVTELDADALDLSPVIVESWAGLFTGDTEFYKVVPCGGCGRTTDPQGTCQFAECEMFEDPQTEGPMMNYYYPLPELVDEEAAAEALAGLPLCVVSFERGTRHGLALTGGGMDLSWEICEGFVRLGYLPPLHFVRLPRMAGKRPTPGVWKVMEACERVVLVGLERLRNDERELALVRLGLHEQEARASV